MSKSQAYNQTQFSFEEPLAHGQAILPPKEITHEQLAAVRLRQKVNQKRILAILGTFLLLVGFVIWITSSWQPSSPSPSISQEVATVTPVPKTSSLRDEIDLLMNHVNQSNRISHSLVFPPIIEELKVEVR